MAQSWGAASRLLAKDVREEERELAKAARKSGLAGSFGSFLGGLGGMALTGISGGILNPITTSLITGGASAAGGLAGKQLFTGQETKETLAGLRGKFLMDDRKELRESLTGDILKGALTAGTTAGLAQFGSNIKGGLTGLGKAKVPDAPNIIGSSAEEIAQTKTSAQSLSELRGKNLIERLREETYARPSPTIQTPAIPSSVLDSDEYREKFFKQFGYYPK